MRIRLWWMAANGMEYKINYEVEKLKYSGHTIDDIKIDLEYDEAGSTFYRCMILYNDEVLE